MASMHFKFLNIYNKYYNKFNLTENIRGSLFLYYVINYVIVEPFCQKVNKIFINYHANTIAMKRDF